MNDKINLCEILKDCPKGTKLYSILYGEVEFNRIEKECTFSIIFATKDGIESTVTSDGKHYNCYDGDCTLFPSKDQRDWSKFTAPWLEKRGEPNPYSGVSFKYNGRTWGMCARDGGVEILVDGEIKERIFLDNEPQGKSALEAINEEKVDNANKVEPKFHEGDWVVDSQGLTHQIERVVENVTTHTFGYDIVGGGYFNDDIKGVHLWTIEDAKDGDFIYVSTEEKGIQAIFHKFENGFIYFHCFLCGDFTQGGYEPIGDIELVYPLQKTHHQRFFQNMKEAGYEWDADKKELKKLVPNRFDPKTLKPFDKVLVKQCDIWLPDFYSCYIEDDDSHVCGGLRDYYFCIPYNDDTKHLAGTKDEAPEYYRYWED